MVRVPRQGISLDEIEKQAILQALEMSDWVQKKAAQLLGLTKRVLNYKIQRHEITHPQWRRNS